MKIRAHDIGRGMERGTSHLHVRPTQHFLSRHTGSPQIETTPTTSKRGAGAVAGKGRAYTRSLYRNRLRLCQSPPQWSSAGSATVAPAGTRASSGKKGAQDRHRGRQRGEEQRKGFHVCPALYPNDTDLRKGHAALRPMDEGLGNSCSLNGIARIREERVQRGKTALSRRGSPSGSEGFIHEERRLSSRE